LDSCDGILKDMIFVALGTGLRFGELISLELKDVDTTNSQLTVRQSLYRGILGGTKSNKIRFVPLLPSIYQLLKSRSRQNNFIFTKDNGEFLSHAICINWLHGACRRAGLRNIGWHTLRHTFASQLAQRGVSITIVKELLGHSDIKTTMRYSHLTASATREAVLRLNENIGHNMATIPNPEINNLIFSIPTETKIVQKTQ
jgi:integrase